MKSTGLNWSSSKRGKLQPGGYWSHTLGTDKDQCLRLYYYRVYGSWGGWKKDDPVAHLIYQAKTSNSLASYTGSLVHNAIRLIIQYVRKGRGRKMAAPEAMIDRIEERMRSEIAYSASMQWEALHHPKRATLILDKHLWGEDINGSEIEDFIKRGRDAMAAFLEHYLPGIIELYEQRGTEGILMIDSLDGVEYRGFKLFMAPDLVLALVDLLEITDWKTGSRSDVKQLKIYALYLVLRFKRDKDEDLDASRITGRSIPLLNLEDIGHIHMTDADIDEARSRIDTDIDDMKRLHVPGLAKEKDVFPKTLHRGLCDYCFYRGYCSGDND